MGEHMEAISLFVQPKPLLSNTIERITKTGELKVASHVFRTGRLPVSRR